jgi:hypothetical protein
MKAYGGVDVEVHIFSDLGTSAPAALHQGKEPPVPTDWVDLRAGLDDVK